MRSANRTRSVVSVAAVVAALAGLAAWLLGPCAGDAPAPPAPSVDDVAAPLADRDATRARASPQPPEAASPAQPVPPPPAPETPEPTFPFEVTVLRSDGVPATGASVVLLADDDDGDWAREVARGTANARGVAALRAVDADVRAMAWLGAESAATGEIVRVRERGAVTLRLGPSIEVRGRVLREGDTPEPGADVELIVQPWYGSDFGLVFRAATDAQGRFSFLRFAAEGVDPLNPPYVEATTKNMARGYATTDLERPDAELVVRLTPGFTVRARFVDERGAPVRDAELVASGARSFRATSDAEGRIEMRLRDAAYRWVALQSPMLWDVRVQRDCVESDVGRSGRALGGHRLGEGDVDLGEVVLPSGRPLTGSVVDESGRAVGGARLSLFLEDVHLGGATSDDQGRFEFPEVGADPHALHASVAHSGPDDRSRRAKIENVRGGDEDVRVVVAPDLAIAFRFLAESDRAPVRATEIRIEARRHDDGDYGAGVQSIGDPRSEFWIALPEAGSYDVDVRVSGYEPQRFAGVEVVEGRLVTLDVLLRRSQR